ncbi:unnamed protein product, partial [Adineta steineri]
FTASACASNPCAANGGGGTCAPVAGSTTQYQCSACTYVSTSPAANTACPASACASNPCAAKAGGGTCGPVAGSTTNYQCSACTYVSTSPAANTPCP